MKNIYRTSVIAAIALLALSCQLDLMPITEYGTEKKEEGGSENPYELRADIEGLRNAMYNSWVPTITFVGTLYYQVMSECRLDNSYNGTNNAKLLDIEGNKISPSNEDVAVTWTRYLQQVSNANTLINYADSVFVKDESWNDEQEKNLWQAEAYCFRSWLWLQATSLWGDIPMTTVVPPSITTENVEEVYPLYYPEATPVLDIYRKIINDLEFACQYAPDTDPTNKAFFTKAFAHGLLARLYARDTELRDWSKVADNCEALEKCGYTLSPKYDDLWGFNETDAFRNNPETIFELQSTKSSGDRLAYMYYYDQYSNRTNFGWAKYLTPSRNLLAAFDKAGDTERLNASVKYDQCTWSLYYPSSNYPFAYKVRTNASSIIFMRLAEIYLLHAEALAAQGDFKGATGYVNKVRERVHLKKIDQPSDYETMLGLILDERRLELAFEGFRFFDVARYGWEKVKAIHDAMPEEDSYWQARRPFEKTDLLLPIPQGEIDKNPNLRQNAGY